MRCFLHPGFPLQSVGINTTCFFTHMIDMRNGLFSIDAQPRCPKCIIYHYLGEWHRLKGLRLNVIHLVSASFHSSCSVSRCLLLHERYQPAESRLSHVELPGETADP